MLYSSYYVFLVENLRFDDFHDSIRKLFGEDVKTKDIQTVFQKIRINPDAKVDWSEVGLAMTAAIGIDHMKNGL